MGYNFQREVVVGLAKKGLSEPVIGGKSHEEI